MGLRPGLESLDLGPYSMILAAFQWLTMHEMFLQYKFILMCVGGEGHLTGMSSPVSLSTILC